MPLFFITMAKLIIISKSLLAILPQTPYNYPIQNDPAVALQAMADMSNPKELP